MNRVSILSDAPASYRKAWGALLDNLLTIFPRAKKKLSNGVVEVMILPDSEMKKLNAKYRKVNKSTDVLSFYIGSSGVVGQIFLARSFTHKHKFLVAHGLLHLAGLDHNTDKDEKKMNALTDLLMYN